MKTAEVIWHCGNPDCTKGCNRRAERILEAEARFLRRKAAVESFVAVAVLLLGFIMLFPWGN